MKFGTALIVSSGVGDFRCHFLEWLDNEYMLCLNRFGDKIKVSQFSVLEIFL